MLGVLGEDARGTITGLWCLTGFSLSIILARISVRLYFLRRFYGDDIVIVFVAALIVVQMATMTLVIQRAAEFEIFGYDVGLGKRHHWWLKQKIAEQAARVYLAGGVAWLCTLWGFKWCVLIWFTRIATEMGKKYKMMIRIGGAIGLLTLASGLAATFVECSPLNELSQIHADPGSMCADTDIPLIIIGSSNIFTDLLMLGISIPLIRKRKNKAPPIFLFCIGLMTTGCGIIRMVCSLRDPNSLVTALWANAEIFCACVVTNGPILRIVLRERAGYKQVKTDDSADGNPGTGLWRWTFGSFEYRWLLDYVDDWDGKDCLLRCEEAVGPAGPGPQLGWTSCQKPLPRIPPSEKPLPAKPAGSDFALIEL